MEPTTMLKSQILKKSYKVGFTLLLLFGLFGSVMGQKIPPRPNPPRLVNDAVGILTPEQKQHLEAKLVDYDDSTSIQIAIVILPDLEDRAPVDFAVKLGREWGVGNKKTNNGVVVLLSMAEGNRQVYIAPGYGLEGALPDITCSKIIQAEMIPNFKEGSYFRGIEKGVDAIIQAARGEYTAPEGYGDKEKSPGGVIFFIVLLLILAFVFGSRGGGGGGDAMSRRGHRHLNRAPPFIFFPGGGFGSGGGGLGSGGGGGFGGFGGGSFGGGGAGGSW